MFFDSALSPATRGHLEEFEVTMGINFHPICSLSRSTGCAALVWRKVGRVMQRRCGYTAAASAPCRFRTRQPPAS